MSDDQNASMQSELESLRQTNADLLRKVNSLADANAYAAELLAALEEANEREQKLVRRGEELDLQTRLDLIMQEVFDEKVLLERVSRELQTTESLQVISVHAVIDGPELDQKTQSQMMRLPLTPPSTITTSNALDVPIYHSTKVLGLLQFTLGEIDDSWSHRWLRMLWSIGSQLGLAIQRLRVVLENQRMNTELIIARDEALEASRIKTAFLANMSHELRTPMNAIIGYSEMLIEDAEELEPEDFVADLCKIQTAGKHLLALINDVLDLSKIEAGKMTVFLEQFDIRLTIDEVIVTLHPLIVKNHNAFSLECPDEIGLMVGDVVKFRQSLFNLLSNATKFTENGEITLKVTTSFHDEVEYILFAISDTGIGMTTEQISRLFQAFVQADSSATRKYGGTGLGLTISRKFCNMLGGDIRVFSEPGRGSTFTMELPRIAHQTDLSIQDSGTADSRPTAVRSSTANSPAKATILSIDDSLEALDIIKRYLTKEGYQVLTASSAEVGLAMAREHLPDVITLDVMMPKMNGWQVLSAIKADPVCGTIPVVLLSVVENKEIGMALGATDCLSKPIDWPRLETLLDRLIHHDNTENILVVEDDAASSELTRRLLERSGWTVRTAQNGSEALKMVQQQTPSLIVLDLMMPVMDGFSFAEILRTEPQYKDIPVIVLTSKSLDAIDHRRLNGKIDEIMTKGQSIKNDLLSNVRRLIDDRLQKGKK